MHASDARAAPPADEPRRTSVTRYWHAPAIPGLSCLHATFTAQHFTPHSHEALVIAVTESGGASYTSRGRSAEATREVLLVFNPVEPHAGHMRHSRYWRYRGFYLASAAIGEMLAAVGRSALPGFRTNAVDDPSLIQAFAAAHRALDDGDAGLGRERLIDACGRLFDAHGDTARRPSSRPAIDRSHVEVALARIKEQSRERLSVEALAAAAGLSPFQLIRRFHETTGMPPRAHLLRARLHDAIRQLRSGTSIAEAAIVAGFYDQSAFTTHFRQAYGITPGQYVRARSART